MSNIKVTPDELDSMAKKLNNLAKQATSLAKSVKSAIDAGTGAWEGDAQREYVSRYKEIEPTLKKTLPELLDNMAKSAQKRAAAYREADKV